MPYDEGNLSFPHDLPCSPLPAIYPLSPYPQVPILANSQLSIVMPQRSQLQPRAWGTRFDTLPISPPVSPSVNIPPMHENLRSPGDSGRFFAAPYRKEDRMPHDASIFVGSLPVHIEQPELTRLLSEHLSEHVEVKSIKVIRDSKGGVCAFVQCENANSAAKLIHNLHSKAPRLFMGRILRYEPARAFRTLLISYRTPVQFIAPTETVEPSNAVNKAVQTVELNLPNVMRLLRHKNPKFFSILYDAQAVTAEASSGILQRQERSLYLNPLVFDGEAIRKLATYFGQIEHFSLYQVPASGLKGPCYPPPHDAPRKSQMAHECWEVKWNHRDDCVSALTTLRRVPHLTVTWAHQLPPFTPDLTYACPSFVSSPGTTLYPLHMGHQPHSFSPFGMNGADATQPRETLGDAIPGSSDHPTKIPTGCPEGGERNGDYFDLCKGDTALLVAPKLAWSDMDFPPLQDHCNEDVGGEETDTFESGRNELHPEGASARVLSHDVGYPPTPDLRKSPITPKTPLSVSPNTPTSNQDRGSLTQECNDVGSDKKEVDSTTLFVGGLEMFGPNAWDEQKVASFFARFGGLQHVKVVRPVNSRAAFAFVKFDNSVSPAHAVMEEHNRVHEGRTMRVQLRDCTPPRNTWRQPRGRGRYQPRADDKIASITPSEAGPSFPPSPFCEGKALITENEQPSFATLVNAGEEPSADPGAATQLESDKPRTCDDTTENRVQTPTHDTPEPQLNDPVSNEPPPSRFHEWYDTPNQVTSQATATPLVPPPTPGSLHIMPTVPYHVPNPGYYPPPPPYLQPYSYPLQFQLPYYGYPGYPMSTQQLPQSYASPVGSEHSGPTSGAIQPWSLGFPGSYVSYTQHPPRTSGLDHPQSASPGGQAPVVPTGFIQHEQGTLIAVYQPEALNQYMSTSQGNYAGGLSSNQAQNLSGWAQYPHGSPYQISTQSPSRPYLPTPAPDNTTTTTWPVTPHSATGYTTPQPTFHNAYAFSGAYGGHRNQQNAISRRAAGRRDHHHQQQQQQHTVHRGNQQGAITDRRPRGPLHPGYVATKDSSRFTPRPATNQFGSGEWVHWPVSR